MMFLAIPLLVTLIKTVTHHPTPLATPEAKRTTETTVVETTGGAVGPVPIITTTGVVVRVNNSGNNGFHGNNGLHGIYHLALIHLTIGVSLLMLHRLNKEESLGQDHNRLLTMLMHPTQLILKLGVFAVRF